MNILERANEIVNHRSEEKERQYGPFDESMQRAAALFNLISPNGETITPEGMFRALVALKLSREAFAHKEDNLLDAVAYLGALNNYMDQVNAEKMPIAQPEDLGLIKLGKGIKVNGDTVIIENDGSKIDMTPRNINEGIEYDALKKAFENRFPNYAYKPKLISIGLAYRVIICNAADSELWQSDLIYTDLIPKIGRILEEFEKYAAKHKLL